MQKDVKDILFADNLQRDDVKKYSDTYLSAILEIGASILEDELDLDPADSSLTVDDKQQLFTNVHVVQNEHLKRIGAEFPNCNKNNSTLDIYSQLIFLN